MDIKIFLKIYFWNIISIVTNFLSVFIVTPFLASDQAIYGIYTLIGSVYIFFSYADLGFMGAAQKFAAENYVKNDIVEEQRVIGFAGFILFLLITLYSIFIIVTAFNPAILIKNISDPREIDVASKLLLILAVTSPTFVLQRVLQVIFAIRLKDYFFQRAVIVTNVLKIAIAFILFRNHSSYPIVNYFLASQLCNIASLVFGLYIARKRFKYPILSLFKFFRFSKAAFIKTKSLAGVSIFLVLCWVLYYELDAFVISKTLGANALAIYAIGLTLSTYFRAVFGIIFNPFSAKFNHFIGLKQYDELNVFFGKVLRLTIPLTVFPVLIVAFTIKSFIFSWVGPGYESSVEIAKFLVLCYVGSFITYPSGLILIAYEKIKTLYVVNAILPAIYWLGIIATVPMWGVRSFAIFKFISFTAVIVMYFFIVGSNYLKSVSSLVLFITKSIILPAAGIFIAIHLLQPYMPYEKSKANLAVYFAYISGIFVVAMVLYVISVKEVQVLLRALLQKRSGKQLIKE